MTIWNSTEICEQSTFIYQHKIYELKKQNFKQKSLSHEFKVSSLTPENRMKTYKFLADNTLVLKLLQVTKNLETMAKTD